MSDDYDESTNACIAIIENAIQENKVAEVIASDSEYSYSESTSGVIWKAIELNKYGVVEALIRYAKYDVDDLPEFIDFANECGHKDIAKLLKKLSLRRNQTF